jgi:uncharacterized BrkB/YihY/UPF0761 family membrane protein
MHTTFRILGTLLIALGALIATLLAWAASKGFFTAKGLILDLPRQGRVTPVSVGTIVMVVLSIVILGLVFLFVGKRPPRKNTAVPNQHQGLSQT